jgi:hypothetical protein
VLTRLTRIAANPRLRIGLLAVVLGFCGYGLYLEWPQVTASLSRLHAYSVIWSLAAAMAGGACMMLAWRAVLADLGSPLPARSAARISFVSQLGKYVPGAVWAFAAQVELAHDIDVPRRRSFAAFAISVALAVAVGLGIAAATLPLTSPGMIRHNWWVLAAVPLIVAGICPPVLGPIIDRGLMLARRPHLERRPTWRGLGLALTWTVLGWLLLGIQVWLLISDMAGRGGYLVLAIGAYALAFSAGVLLVAFPGGIGPREFFLVAALTPVMPHGTAVAVALMTRVVTTASDLACAGLGLALSPAKGRGAARSRPAAAIMQPAQVQPDWGGPHTSRSGRAPGRHRKPGAHARPERPSSVSDLASGANLPGGQEPIQSTAS